MINIPALPKTKPTAFPSARLLADERCVDDWFWSLGPLDRRHLYTVSEIRAATGIPATRLHVVLYRLGWRRRPAPKGFTIPLFQGPFARVEKQENDAFVTLLDKTTGMST